MTVTVWEQAYSLLGGLVLGVATGLLYELLRCVRYRVRGRIFCALLDLLFWLLVTVALFLWSVAAGRGVVRLSVCAALFLGCAGYLHFLSPPLLPHLLRPHRPDRPAVSPVAVPFSAFEAARRRRFKKIFWFFQKTLSFS